MTKRVGVFGVKIKHERKIDGGKRIKIAVKWCCWKRITFSLFSSIIIEKVYGNSEEIYGADILLLCSFLYLNLYISVGSFLRLYIKAIKIDKKTRCAMTQKVVFDQADCICFSSELREMVKKLCCVDKTIRLNPS